MTPDPITAQQRSELLAVFVRHSDVIERVDLFGSRAVGRQRAGSDIDLAIAGPVSERRLASIAIEIDASWISVHVDVHAYDLLQADAFGDRVRATAVALFDRADLIAERGMEAA